MQKDCWDNDNDDKDRSADYIEARSFGCNKADIEPQSIVDVNAIFVLQTGCVHIAFMTQQQPMSIWNYLLSRDALMTIIIPIVLYNLVFHLGGVGAALLLTTLYSILLKFISKTKGIWVVIVLMLVSGINHFLYIHGYTLFDIKQEEVFRSVSSAASLVSVFCFYSLIGKPAARTMAEQAMPRLKMSTVYGTPLYVRVWHEVSIAWIFVYSLKTVGLYFFSNRKGFPIDDFIFFCGHPLTLLMIIFSYYWPKYRWKKAKRKSESIDCK
ncbi:hypothetical protein [Xenorhabdus siamensis]|uniref:hypothetical protein n=1 Tax=Xenorhabdus siamensis TaxID=3136254 RepID=UPI0030F446E0